MTKGQQQQQEKKFISFNYENQTFYYIIQLLKQKKIEKRLQGSEKDNILADKYKEIIMDMQNGAKEKKESAVEPLMNSTS